MGPYSPDNSLKLCSARVLFVIRNTSDGTLQNIIEHFNMIMDRRSVAHISTHIIGERSPGFSLVTSQALVWIIHLFVFKNFVLYERHWRITEILGEFRNIGLSLDIKFAHEDNSYIHTSCNAELGECPVDNYFSGPTHVLFFMAPIESLFLFTLF
jgi:hypothetical protein